ncbi:MAG: acyl-CoA thioesterase [Gammaproteobacteria bacterium]|nr:acyl-CoA thioesterase [Gammaproteobacteria bacterium]NND39124.1 acyl-CoA thioesterase [Pseudomonadales bacterium]MBT8151817.1 acyl-CoA thioesterase [Gammaproteobacteria bacterium]NNL11176.1 acyl-CoA thioesterase [Pseudomonadales bacterium]NNM10557.1 acyl-CoA thioesterase [Pseudomonadales bacterium]
MEHYKIVLPEDLNDYGSLFGGTLLKWVDEIAYIRVSLDFPGRHFVTIGLDSVEFRHRIEKGQILRFVCEKTRVGTTSVTYNVSVYAARYSIEINKVLFESNITFVCVDADGSKQSILGAS